MEIQVPKIAVNNPNIIIVASKKEPRSGEPISESQARRNRKVVAVRLIRRAKLRLREMACSSTWAEDCLFRGAQYAPNFKCKCFRCTELFRRRLYPPGVRESDYSLDCQVEADEDPEFAQDFARLRNDWLRAGSVVIGH
jgi:hypothetical protein